MSSPAGRVERRPVVIAGASAGIGAEIARTLGGQGYPVALGSRRVDRCELLAADIREAGGEALAHPLDVSDTESVVTFAKAVQDQLGPMAAVVLNAGGMRPGLLWEISSEDFAAELDTNVVGAHRLVAAFVPDMIERQYGDVVVISSDVVVHPRPGLGGYVSAKWGLEGLARVLQLELEGTGVRASIVRPGPTQSEIAAGWDMDAALKVVERTKPFGFMRHWAVLEPAAVAATVAHVIGAPPGVHIPVVDIAPEAPVRLAPSPPVKKERR